MPPLRCTCLSGGLQDIVCEHCYLNFCNTNKHDMKFINFSCAQFVIYRASCANDAVASGDGKFAECKNLDKEPVKDALTFVRCIGF